MSRNAGAVTLTHAAVAGDFLISGTGLLLMRHRRPPHYEIIARGGQPAARHWLTDTGLKHQRFARRQDLLHAVGAHAAVIGLPETHAPTADLVRRSDGSHVTAEGDFEIRPRPADPDSMLRAGWSVINLTGPAMARRAVPTLHAAAEIIMQMRDVAAHPEWRV